MLVLCIVVWICRGLWDWGLRGGGAWGYGLAGVGEIVAMYLC